jgi:large-conductance mechanosensitive channel
MILPIIILASISISIGISSYTFIQSFVYDIILPAIAMLFNMITHSKYFDKFLVSREFAFMHFLSELIVYIFMTVAVWIVVSAIIKLSGKKMVTEPFASKGFPSMYNIDQEENYTANYPGVTEEADQFSNSIKMPKFDSGDGFAKFANF